jgi:hypothetical protein
MRKKKYKRKGKLQGIDMVRHSGKTWHDEQ